MLESMSRESKAPDAAVLTRLAVEVAENLAARGETVATAESCTGGWVAKCLTDVPGSSAWFRGGVVAYSNAAKRSLLGVPAADIDASGAVSEAVARAMAAGALSALGADSSVAVTGVAGPDGGTADKPVGTVWFAWARRGGATRAECVRFDGDRDAVRRAAVARALEGLLRDD